MSRRAIERSRRFGEQVFRGRLLEIVGRLGVPVAA
jgi:hypothetical protein